MMAEQPKATGGQPIRYWSFKYPAEARPNTIAQEA
jgi:hypothetical protein